MINICASSECSLNVFLDRYTAWAVDSILSGLNQCRERSTLFV